MTLHRIDDLCDDFEAALRRGEPVRIEDYVEQVPEELRSKLLRELLEIEIEFSATRSSDTDGGEPPVFRLQQSLKDRFPEQGELVDSVVRRVAKLRQIGDYEILEELGHGGMGIVYKARQKLLNQVVAIKVLSQTLLDDPQAVGRFRREMQLIGGLNHSNIVRALNAGESDGMHYLVMEFVDGTTLQRLCDTLRKDQENESLYAPTVKHDSMSRDEAKGSTASAPGAGRIAGPVMPLAAACEAIRQAALGLEHAHQFGLVHRDIKPANLMLDRSGSVKVLDLGLGKFLAERRLSEDEASLTMAGTTIGTIDYISPEQCENAAEADIRSDIYSLGCTLYFLAVGKAPYTGSRYDTTRKKLMAHIVGEIPKLDKRLPDVPPELEAVLEKMLAKEPEERFQTPIEVADAIAPFASFEELYELSGGTMEGGHAARPGSTSRMLGSNTLQTRAVTKPKTGYTRKLRSFLKLLWGIVFLIAIVACGTVIGINYLIYRYKESPPVTSEDDRKSSSAAPSRAEERKADLALLPGLYGAWWFEETPWLLPVVRETLIEAVDAPPLSDDDPEYYFGTNIPAVRDRLWQSVEKRLDSLPPKQRELVEKLHGFCDSNSVEQDDEKMLAELPTFLADGSTATELHSRAVLEHRLAVLRSDKELAVAAAGHYAAALDRYRHEIQLAGTPAESANRLGLLELLCRSDAARLEYLATGSYDKAIEKFEDVRTRLRTFEYRSPLFQVELQAAFGALCAEAGRYQDSVFTWGLENLKRTRLGKGLHPLTAQLAERYAWSLIDQWKIAEAETQFREAMLIRVANQRESGDRFGMIYIWHDWHAMAMTLRYLGNTQQAIDEYRKTLTSIDKELEACRAGMKSADEPAPRGLRQFYAKVRDRAANTRERLADCTFYGGAASGVNHARLGEMARLYGEAADLYDIEIASRAMRAKQAIVLLLQDDTAGAERILCDLDECDRQLLGNRTRTDLIRQAADAILAYKKSEEGKKDAGKAPLRQFLTRFSVPSNPTFADATRRETLELRMFCAEYLVNEAIDENDMAALAADLPFLLQPIGFFQDRSGSKPFLRRISERMVRSYAIRYENLPKDSPARQAQLWGIVRLLEWMRLPNRSGQGQTEAAADTLVVFFLADVARDGFVVFYPLDVSRKGAFFPLPLTRKEIKDGARRQDEKPKLDPELLRLIDEERKAGRRVSISWSDESSWPQQAENALTDNDWPFEELTLKGERR